MKVDFSSAINVEVALAQNVLLNGLNRNKIK